VHFKKIIVEMVEVEDLWSKESELREWTGMSSSFLIYSSTL